MSGTCVKFMSSYRSQIRMQSLAGNIIRVQSSPTPTPSVVERRSEIEYLRFISLCTRGLSAGIGDQTARETGIPIVVWLHVYIIFKRMAHVYENAVAINYYILLYIYCCVRMSVGKKGIRGRKQYVTTT